MPYYGTLTAGDRGTIPSPMIYLHHLTVYTSLTNMAVLMIRQAIEASKVL